MATPFFVADSASVTILRTLASSAFGSYNLQVPEGIDLEDVHDFEAPGNELGHVTSLNSDRRVGGLARRFVRADVSVTAADPSDPDLIPASDVDAVLTEAATRVSSDFFLESDVSKAGLGPWVPFVDFQVGDMANIDVWGNIVTLPVTRIEQLISDHDTVDYLVHVGGQLVSDEDARLVENEAMQKAFIQDRRELAGLELATTKAVAEVKDTADSADARSQQTNAGLTGDPDKPVVEAVEDADTPIGGIKNTAEVADGKAETANENAGIAWTHADNAQNRAIAANTNSIKMHENRMNWMKWTNHQQFWVGRNPVNNDWVHLEMFPSLPGLTPRPASVHITPKPGWRGKITMIARFGSGDVDIAHWDHHVIDGSGEKVEYHAASSGWNYQSAVILISPLWGPDPREYVLNPDGGGGFIPNDDYHNELEWNPLNWVGDTGIQPNAVEMTNGMTVSADTTVRVLTTFNDDYVFYGAGLPIFPGWFIAPLEDSLTAVKLTEVR